MELGSQHVVEGTGERRRIVREKDAFTYVPLLKSIESMLQDEAILEEVIDTCMIVSTNIACKR